MTNSPTVASALCSAIALSVVAASACGGGNTPTTPPTPVATLDSISVNPATVVAPNPVQGTATLTAPAPAGGATVTLSSNNAAATVPASVLVAAGTQSMGFSVTTSGSGAATISGSFGGVTRTAQLTVNPGLVANFTVRSTRAAQRKLTNPDRVEDIPGLGVGTADACPLFAQQNSGNRFLSCVLDGSTSTAAGSSITQYQWTYRFATATFTENTTSPMLTPAARDCGFFGNGTYAPSVAGGISFIQLIVELRVLNAQGVLSDVRQNQNIRVFPGGNCGYAF